MSKRGVYGISLIKIGAIGLGGFIDIPLTITSGQNILVMWDVLVVNGMRQSLIKKLEDPDYNIMMMSTFSGFTVTEGQKEEREIVNQEVVKLKYPKVVNDH